MTFIVRLGPARGGRLTGVVERVRTGEKHRFDGLDHLGAILGRAAPAAAGPRAAEAPPSPRPGPPPGAGSEA
jgi:hypothetical protein